jgi:protoheme IX farnesyltransferase
VSLAATAVVGWLLTQIAIGATMVSMGVPPLGQVLHVAGAAGLWVSTVTLAALSYRDGGLPVEAGSTVVEPRRRRKPQAPKGAFRAYVNLTKPRIIMLLLATTFPAMLIAAKGMPAWHTILFTMIGGALGAGAANAVNCYIDSDIDAKMARTAVRAIPAGVVQPKQAFLFGIVLQVLSFVILAVFVNVLSAVLTLAAFAFYVLVYTRWLKRSTVHNIVIGGAAGAVPPLVGWAAITGDLSLLAIYLFAVIFFWTPPHFWALALLIKRDYAEAGVPMLPVVKGDAETRRQITLYTALLAVLTVGVVAFGLLGPVYLVGAAILGVLFLAYAIQLQRQATEAAARRLFRYSLVYLPLLFCVIVVDRLI